MTARRGRRRRRQAQAVTAVALIAVAVAAAVIVAHVIGWVAITAAVGAACWYTGHRARPASRARTTPAANARSLAQLNRHLNTRLDATQAKLEAAMDRADRAEEAARAARDDADHLADAPGRQ